MASNKPSRIIPPTGLRTPSPTKSRLVPGSNLPQRATSVKGVSSISLQPSIRKPLAKEADIVKKPSLPRTKLQQQQTSGLPPHDSSDHRPGLALGKSSRANHLSNPRTTPASSAKSVPGQDSGQFVISREALESRIELLHLHTIHKESLTNQSQWKESAFNNYKQQFETLQHRAKKLDQQELESLVQKNATAILSWCKEGNSLERQIQSLSGVITEIDRLTSPSGEYTSVVQSFEHWIASTTSIPEQRTRPASKGRLNVIESLGDGWLAEIEILQSKLVSFADVMLGLDEATSGGADLERVITVASEMLKNMLEELDMITTLETTIVQREKDRIEGSVASLTTNLERGLSLE